MNRTFLLLSLFLSVQITVYASTDDIDAIKKKNKPDHSRCGDLRKQSRTERSRSEALKESLKSYLVQKLTNADRKRRIMGAMAAVGTEGNNSVFIFYIDSPLSAEPGHAFRFENRQRLETLVSQWRIQSKQDPTNTFFVRFDDECEIPVADWK